ncbi:MAG TPA: hypothetical protein VK066_11315 [Chloroflexota bacterium]|nr:hypothetical protein [Chloroflexota bacterium]
MSWLLRPLRVVLRVAVLSAVVSALATALVRRLGLAPAVAALVL